MTETDDDTRKPRLDALRIAQVLLLIAAVGLWVASRFTWVVVSSSDGLGPARTTELSGASWSTALIPLAVILVAAAVAGLAVRGWLLRLLAVLVAVACAATGYLAISLWVVPDVAPMAVELAQVAATAQFHAERRYAGAVLTFVSAAVALLGAVLLMRVAVRGPVAAAKYERAAARRAATSQDDPQETSERSLWDALDDGVDPTDKGPEPSTEPSKPLGEPRTEPDTEGR